MPSKQTFENKLNKLNKCFIWFSGRRNFSDIFVDPVRPSVHRDGPIKELVGRDLRVHPDIVDVRQQQVRLELGLEFRIEFHRIRISGRHARDAQAAQVRNGENEDERETPLHKNSKVKVI